MYVPSQLRFSNAGLFSTCNSITALDVSGNTALETLECFNTSITALDLSNNVLLKDLQCGYANLKELHVENNPALENLSCEGTYKIRLSNAAF